MGNSIVCTIILIFIVLIIVKKIINSNKSKGAYGELLTDRRLELSNLFGKEGQILRNVYIPKDNGETSEIDVMYITKKGIFVIESKNYSGYIFGSEDNQKWTVTLYAGKGFLGRNKVEKHQFYNPVKQNSTHIKNLIKYLGVNYPTYSIIAFSERCDLKSIEINSPNIFVCNRNNINRIIGDVWKNTPDLISNDEIDKIVYKLKNIKLDSTIKEQHVEQIKRKLNDDAVCPLCDGKLVKRIAKSGIYKGNEFYGCSNYPKCKYIKK